MLWQKNRYLITISGGSASFNSDIMRGMIEQIIITPNTSTTTWDFTMTDRDGDIMYQRVSETGTNNDRTAWVPVGRDSSEKFTCTFANVTANEVIKVILKVREQY